ncbi:MAG: hypothetical protein JWM76_4142 [Pseudonocardiales bacterium]|nr:hypothetical protein [Pseudonocardiales bacterium]
MFFSPAMTRALTTAATAIMVGSILVATTRTAASANPTFPSQTTPSHSGSSGSSGSGRSGGSTVPVPAVMNAGAGTPVLAVGTFALSSVGYSESEYFLSGTASAYVNVGPLASDGKWTVKPTTAEAYKTRIVVLRPANSRRFSGTVVVEWLNVSAGQDSPADWSLAHDEMIRSGDIYVGVSAQAVGVNALKVADPARYGSLTHPGDSYSYDIFSQAGQAVRKAAGTVLGGLRPQTVIGDGESQSAFRLTTYVNAVAPLANVFDSYLIHSRAGGGSDLSQAPLTAIPVPAVVYTRTDLKTPVLTFQTETDLLVLGYYPATQADSRNFRLWEVAGTAHADAYILQVSATDDGSKAADTALFALMKNPPSQINIGGFTASCTAGFNTGQQHYVFQTALRRLVFWTQTGIAPRSMARLAVNPATATAPASYQVDANGNVLGGIRSPAVDAPVATLSGLPPVGAPGFCVLFGTTAPFTSAQLAALYPTNSAFVREWRSSVLRGVLAGYLLPEDAARLFAVV